MAIIIPTVSSCSEKITAGEKDWQGFWRVGSANNVPAGMIPEWETKTIILIL